MKKLITIIIGITLIISACSIEDATSPGGGGSDPEPLNALVINEFMSHNDLAWPGPNNDYPDWVELYNGTDATIDVGGYFLSDDAGEPEMSMIPEGQANFTTIAPGDYLVLIADGKPEEGPLHMDFKISDNEDVTLSNPNGDIIDSRDSGVIPDDQSEGRVPDGTDNWEILDPSTPGTSNGGETPVEYDLYINEFMASNDYGPVDEHGNHDDWIEIYNAGDEAIDIGGMYLTDDLNELTNSQIPTTHPDSTTIPAGGFLVLWADKEPEQGILHLADVKLSGGGEQIGLTDSDGTTVIDSLTYGDQTTDVSKGRLPDASDTWDYFGQGHATMYTPGASNGGGAEPQVLFINEFMASNDYAPVDEYGEHEDWIEIYNASSEPIDIGGMYFTDELSDLTNSQIPTTHPDSTTIPAGGYIVVWADKDPEQGILHLEDVKLSGGGEQIGLTDSDGTTVIDSLTYGDQTTDVSKGRTPDGTNTWEYFGQGHDTMYTPGFSNDAGEAPKLLYINEFMSHNDNIDIPEAPGEYPDWIELYNNTDAAIDIGGMYLTDDMSDLTQSMIPTDDPTVTTIQPGEFLVLVADGEPTLGILHLDFKLGDDEDFALVDTDGTTIIDEHNTTVIPDDQSEGRYLDGTDNWKIFEIPTPGAHN